MRLGITDYAQEALGEVVFVGLPEVGRRVRAGETVAEIDSTKSVAEVYAPLDGVVDVNAALAEHPELVNSDPYGEGWFILLGPTTLPRWTPSSTPPPTGRWSASDRPRRHRGAGVVRPGARRRARAASRLPVEGSGGGGLPLPAWTPGTTPGGVRREAGGSRGRRPPSPTTRWMRRAASGLARPPPASPTSTVSPWS